VGQELVVKGPHILVQHSQFVCKLVAIIVQRVYTG
jgi:hypothetical protein